MEDSCDNGTCKAMDGNRWITNCIYCGKELVEREGCWWTWDFDLFPESLPQDYVVKGI